MRIHTRVEIDAAGKVLVDEFFEYSGPMALAIEPTTIAKIAFSVIGAGTQAIGAIKQGKAQQAESDFRARVLTRDAEQDRLNAAAAARDQKARNVQFLKTARALQGGTGRQTGTGSLLRTLVDIETENALSEARIKFGGEQTARSREVEARLFQLKGRSARQASFLGAGAALLTGGKNIATALA
jgi:hypothetical protein